MTTDTDDITDTLAPKSEQLDAIELTAPRTFQIERVVVKNGTEQPVAVWLVGFPRPWMPGKNMRRVLAFCWGAKSSAWVGRWVRLFCDDSVVWAGEAVGGVRIQALSDIDGPKKAPVLLSQGRPGTYPVEVLAAAQVAPTEQPLPDRIEAAVAAFGRGGVTQQQLEAKVALPRDEWGEQTLAELESLFARLKAGETTKDAEFDTTGADE